ncbi:STY4851/ECs_5259 family protein [Microbulbifer yueqingensis]|uniref:Uncharacterized protein n=1 Tax=Microbulbifer yueqingensis TaxID=658219 RepID=A0A1G9DFF1_9GAMM|nr:STY4851/ECs_5259 family protein [Microbulbifer yueqingensis]SDK62587.1 hypothetical protein SAMN05216212_2780 [Microbulbifer yueqingensis]
MTVITTVTAREWLAKFRLERVVTRQVEGSKIPDGRPLFGYHVSSGEYAELEEVLKSGAADRDNPTRRSYWAACYCLYIAESFRRNYDASEGGWSWKGFDSALGIHLNPIQRSEIVDMGLAKYWNRPIRMRTNGRDILGSLAAEGGLPWKMVQHESHGFGRAVRAGLNKFYENRDAGRSTAEFLEDYLSYLPQTFRNVETRQLLAGIVEQLVFLVEQYPITKQEDPASYLDQHLEGWRQGFPIPLGEENGRALVNEWLRRADRSRGERARKVEELAINRCTHWLDSERFQERALITEVTLPKEIRFVVDPLLLRSTRLELGFYEGSSLLAKAGAVYGQLGGDEGAGVEMVVRLPRQHFRLERRQKEQPLKVTFLASGQEVYAESLDDSSVTFAEAPLLFEQGDQGWILAGDGSRKFSTSEALLWAPKEAIVESEEIVCCHEDIDGRWLGVATDVTLRLGEETYRFTPGAPETAGPKLLMKGRAMLENSLPGTVYRGWPQLTTEAGGLGGEQYVSYINGKPGPSDAGPDRYGAFRYKVANRQGETLLLRKIGVLPDDLMLSILPASARAEARVRVTTTSALIARVEGETIEPCAGQLADGVITVPLKYNGGRPPAAFRLLLSSPGEQPVELRLDFPFDGIRYLDATGEEVIPEDILADQLLGSQLVLSSGVPGRQVFNIQMLLMGGTAAQIRRHYSVVVSDRPVSLSLFAFSDDIRQMLSATDDQDNFIRFSVDSLRPLMRFNIRRYNTNLKRENATTFRLLGARATSLGEIRKVEVMLLSDPAMKPRELDEVSTAGVGMGAFELPLSMMASGPWLLYPKPGAEDQFRPELVPTGRIEGGEQEIQSLHAATRAYHPTQNPTVIDAQISRMADDLSHSGWGYLQELWDNFRHLPLSTFEAWKALARNPRALSLAVFRLEFDEHKALRFQEELSVIWEFITLTGWHEAYAGYAAWLEKSGVPQILVGNILTQRSYILERLISGFADMESFVKAGDCADLKQIPPGGILAFFFQELRRNYPDFDSWPSYLGSTLRQWTMEQGVERELASHSNTHETNAVAYLPVFLGYVTAGKAKPEDLGVNSDFLKFAIRVVADFDRQGWFVPAHAVVTNYLMTK